jgi:hypothetical protein
LKDLSKKPTTPATTDASQMPFTAGDLFSSDEVRLAGWLSKQPKQKARVN